MAHEQIRDSIREWCDDGISLEILDLVHIDGVLHVHKLIIQQSALFGSLVELRELLR